MKRTARQLQHLKSTRVRVGEGHPTPNEGSTGDLSLRMTKTGLKLFAKFGNKWYVIGQGPLKQLSGDSQDVTLDENNRKGTQLKTAKAGKLQSGQSIRLETKKAGGFSSYVNIDKNVGINASNDLLLSALGDIKLSSIMDLECIIQSPQTGYPQLTIKSTAGSSSGPVLNIKNLRSDSAVDGDDHGNIKFWGKNSAAEEIQYSGIFSETHDKTDGSEKAQMHLAVYTSGGLQDGLRMTGSSVSSEVDVTIGAGTASVLTIAGDIAMSGDDIVTAGALTLDIAGDLTLDANTGIFHLQDAGDSDDEFKITVVGGTGATTLETVSAGADGHLTVKSDGKLILDSTGSFIASKSGTEFSATNSAYAGMILGYTCLLNDAADTSYAVTTSFVTVDATTKVTFTAPPSGNVEIFVNIFDDAGTGRPLYLGLSDNATYNAIDVTHEHVVGTVDETDEKEINHRWVITGLTAGTSYTYWLGAKSSHSSVHTLKWGGDATGEYAPFIMKATALPATLYDGS